MSIMINAMLAICARVSLFGSILGWQAATAELSILMENPGFGYHAIFENRNFQCLISQNGKIMINAIGKKGVTISQKLAVPIEIGIEEILPDGTATFKGIQPKSLQSSSAASHKLEKTTFKGNVKGGASFEATVEQKNGEIIVGGRILDPGTLTKNPIRFAVRINFPSCYPNVKKLDDKKQKKSRENKSRDDRILLKLTDGKRIKLDVAKNSDSKLKELKGPNLASAVIDIYSYQGKKWIITASEDSKITLSNSSLKPLYEGFSINWFPNPSKDQESRARLSIQLR